MNKWYSLVIICALTLCVSECYANNTLTMYATEVGLYHLDIKNRVTIYRDEDVELVRCIQADKDAIIILWIGTKQDGYQFERDIRTGKYTITVVKARRSTKKYTRIGFVYDVKKDFFSNFNVKVVK